MMYAIMHRTQLLLESWQYDALRGLAERSGRSLAAVIRSILAEHLARLAKRGADRLDSIAGIAEGPPDLATDHDRHLYGPKRKRGR